MDGEKIPVTAEWLSAVKSHKIIKSGCLRTDIYEMDITFKVKYSQESTDQEKIEAIVKAYKEAFNINAPGSDTGNM